MRVVLFGLGAVVAVLLLVFGLMWTFKTLATTVNASSVQHKVIEVEGRRYLVIVSSDGVAVCPLLVP